jgi:hypothetical protein
MKESIDPHLEGQLLRHLAAFQRGNQDAARLVFNLVMKPTNRPLPDAMLPVLRQMLGVDNQDIQIAATVGLASMKQRAQAALPDLRELALSNHAASAEAAVCAIGAIPGSDAVAALLEVLEHCKASVDQERASVVVETCANRASDFQEHVERLASAVKEIFAGDEEMCKQALDKVRHSSRDAISDVFGLLQMPNAIDMRHVRDVFYVTGGMQGAVAPRPIPEGSGAVVDERFNFLGDSASEIGLRIYRHPTASNAYLVAFVSDGESYGDWVTNCVEDLATTVREVYGLRDANITWLDITTADSGLTAENRDECEQVLFAPTESRSDWLRDPKWKIVGDFPKFLDAWQRKIA